LPNAAADLRAERSAPHPEAGRACFGPWSTLTCPPETALTARLDKVADAGGLDAIFDKVAKMERELQAKRAELAEQQRLNRRPPVKRGKEKDVAAALAQLRQLLQVSHAHRSIQNHLTNRPRPAGYQRRFGATEFEPATISPAFTFSIVKRR